MNWIIYLSQNTEELIKTIHTLNTYGLDSTYDSNEYNASNINTSGKLSTLCCKFKYKKMHLIFKGNYTVS